MSEQKNGLENAPKVMQDFVNLLQNQNKVIQPIVIEKKPFFINKYKDAIIGFLEKPYKIIQYFLLSAVVLAVIVEQVIAYV